MFKNWKLKPKIPPELLKSYPNLHPVVAQLLYNRELLENGQYKEFLEAGYEGLNDPFLFKDMQKATERIWKAIDNNQKITIYGDYDADAVTANAVLRQAFYYLGFENVNSYIPDRFTEGYGVNLEALSKIKDDGTKLVITVDCGTNSAQAAKWCFENGMDFIITDHHEIIGDAPEFFALVNPKNRGDNYPDANITGVGVAFKMVQALLSDEIRVQSRFNQLFSPEGTFGHSSPILGRVNGYVKGYEKWLLDLVAIGTVADCHSLTGENRIFVKYGLKVLGKTKWPGLKALFVTAKLDFLKKGPSVYTLGFVLAPRLNAAGRLEHAGIALDLLLEKEYSQALEKAAELENINRRRQNLTLQVVSEAKEQALKINDRKFLVVMGDDWPQGVVGLAAGRLADEFKKPVIVLTKLGEEAVGSARTAGDYNVVEALKYAAQHLIAFGGHIQAAGLTLKTKEFKNFYKKLLEHADKHINSNVSHDVLELEASLLPEHLSLEVVEEISRLEPFGVGNPPPKFLIEDLKLELIKKVGNGGLHVQMRLRSGGKLHSAIWFRAGERAAGFSPGDLLSVVCELTEDSWNGNSNLKLKIAEVEK